MPMENPPMSAQQALELYFPDNRARLLELASFLDRIDRYKDSAEAKNDFRYKSLIKALKLILGTEKDRTTNVQLLFSDLSAEPIENAAGLRAFGAWEGAFREGN